MHTDKVRQINLFRAPFCQFNFNTKSAGLWEFLYESGKLDDIAGILFLIKD